ITTFTDIIHTCRTPPKKGFSIITTTSSSLKSRLRYLLSKHYTSPITGLVSPLNMDALSFASWSPNTLRLDTIPLSPETKRGSRGVTFNWMDTSDQRGNKRMRSDDGGYISDSSAGGGGGKKPRNPQNPSGPNPTHSPLTDDEVRDKLTPLWREYLVDVDPKRGTRKPGSLPYHLYKKTMDAKRECMVKVVKQARGAYQDKLEARNRDIKKAKSNGRYDSMTEAQRTKEFGEQVVYPSWTDKKAHTVTWCGGEEGIIGLHSSPTGYRNKCELTMKV
ncbi:hypothetical protein TrRE_jg581, partial [Triparma retinervis]